MMVIVLSLPLLATLSHCLSNTGTIKKELSRFTIPVERSFHKNTKMIFVFFSFFSLSRMNQIMRLLFKGDTSIQKPIITLRIAPTTEERHYVHTTPRSSWRIFSLFLGVLRLQSFDVVKLMGGCVMIHDGGIHRPPLTLSLLFQQLKIY